MEVGKAFILEKSNVIQQKLPCLNIVKKVGKIESPQHYLGVIEILIFNTIDKKKKREFKLIFFLKF